jgi:hypothetical protein
MMHRKEIPTPDADNASIAKALVGRDIARVGNGMLRPQNANLEGWSTPIFTQKAQPIDKYWLIYTQRQQQALTRALKIVRQI